jgi:hypothetical protein
VSELRSVKRITNLHAMTSAGCSSRAARSGSLPELQKLRPRNSGLNASVRPLFRRLSIKSLGELDSPREVVDGLLLVFLHPPGERDQNKPERIQDFGHLRSYCR